MSQDERIAHPRHYIGHPSGIECIDVVEHMNFNLGNVVKYCWRCDQKNGIEDLREDTLERWRHERRPRQ